MVDEVIKVEANLVNVFFTVKDKAGNLVPHLTKDDCSISEDKAPQTLKNFVAETHQPLTLGILLDTSGSQQNVLPLEQDAGTQFLERVLKPKDEAFLLSFDVNVDLLQDYTNSARQLGRATTCRFLEGARVVKDTRIGDIVEIVPVLLYIIDT